MRQLFFLVLLIASLSACKSDTSEAVPASQAPANTRVTTENSELIANIDYLRVRETPGQDGKIIATLGKGDSMTDLGEVSAFTTKVTLRGIQFDEPWLKVKTSDGVEGWIYGGGVHFSLDDQSPVTKRLLDQRLSNTFGGTLADQILKYQEAYQSARTSEEFALVYRRGEALRDSLVGILEQKIQVLDYEKLPDLYWIEESIPGYITQLVAEGTMYYLFMDYKQMYRKAARTEGKEDDDFLDICMQVHQQDSVEYFFPAWFLQTWDYGGSSELGKGVHNTLLGNISKALEKSPMFNRELQKLKEAMLTDIHNPDNTYWYPQEDILVELDQIIAADYPILTDADKRALALRRDAFADSAANGIKVNYRSGMYE